MSDDVTYNELMWSLEEEKDKMQVDKKGNDMRSEIKPSKADNTKSVLDKAKELPAKADHIAKNFRLWARKRKNLSFYKKYLDRVRSGLYDRYAGEAQIMESTMVDDPVTVLKGPAKSYISHLVNKTNELYKVISEISKKLENATTAEEAINVVKGYCKDVEGKSQNIKGDMINDDKSSWKEKIIRATRYKLATILFKGRDTGIYGYTVKSCVLKHFPKPNHLIVTLFCQDPEEHPHEQSVSEIFKSADSFDILANSDKTDIFNVANMTSAVLNKTVNGNVMNEIKENKSLAISNFKKADVENKKDEAKIIDSVWDGVNASCKLLLGQKSYLIKCINIYFDMILRIDNLAVNSIKNLLLVENAHRDKRYDKHSKLSHQRDLNSRGITPEMYEERTSRVKRIRDATKRLNRM